MLLPSSEHFHFQPKTLFSFSFLVFGFFSLSISLLLFPLLLLFISSHISCAYSLFPDQTLFVFSLSLSLSLSIYIYIYIYSLSKLTSFVSCFTPQFLGKDDAPRTFLSGLILAISSLRQFSTIYHGCTL
jgi:hypothetical protein